MEVSGAALSVQTENAKVQTSVENKFIDELPLVVGAVAGGVRELRPDGLPHADLRR